MIIPEYEAKELLKGYGLYIPPGEVAVNPDEAREIAAKLGGRAVVKALIPTGGRGKAGGVKLCETAQEVFDAAALLLGKPLLGHTVERVLIDAAQEIIFEIYTGVIVNVSTGWIDLVVSLAGGMDIEQAAKNDSSAILRLETEPGELLPVYRVRGWLSSLKNPPAHLNIDALARVLVALHRAAADLDSILLEVNPLAVLSDGRLAVLDCKLEVDDNGLSRQPEMMAIYLAGLGEREKQARSLGVSYVPLDGDIAVITSGAGLGMATLDMLKRRNLQPANFLDTGGGISANQVMGALELVMGQPHVRGAIVNLYGGINRMQEAAKGIIAALENIPGDRPVVVKVMGNQQEEAWAMLEKAPQVHVIRVVQTEAAVEKLAEQLG
ncbi:MAG: acetate--CoA ligase family protein [Anaerolineales bacterium]|nr:acetate--CoA ligase family protein [Anaerolineales bacterium]